ncbi:MAG TPA: universal stress protein [Desulfuromonadales bacterium]|nr:universal stress protein [Desulfuromonadales bacterium]
MLPKISKILYATGLGAGAPYVFRYALSQAQQYDAGIVAVHGMEPLSAFAQSLVEQYVSHENSEEMHRQARETVKAALRGRIEQICAKENGGDLESCRITEIRIVEGQPAQVILETAKKVGADLIVMGAHRHTALGETLIGTATRKVLHSSEVPVLVVRIPEGFREDGF